jgi:hypothetical protein
MHDSTIYFPNFPDINPHPYSPQQKKQLTCSKQFMSFETTHLIKTINVIRHEVDNLSRRGLAQGCIAEPQRLQTSTSSFIQVIVRECVVEGQEQTGRIRQMAI